ncbi:ABC transporter ATP-binding protein [[Eubacterium] cellulosolvens]
MTSLVDIQNVSHASGKSKSDLILDNINLSINENEFVGVVGPSGSGKSTLLRIIIGLIKPKDGAVYYRGERVEDICKGMSMVFQTFALFPWLTVFENIELGLQGKPFSKSERRDRVLKIIEFMGLSGFEEAYPRELSRGMKQRVGLARGLIPDPELILMDEPFSSLDALTATHLREEVLDLWLDPSLPPEAVIMVTHNVEEAVYMADRIVILTSRPGKIAKELEVTLPRPRDPRSNELYKIVDEITGLIA